MSEQKGKFSLSALQAQAPAVNPVEAMRRSLAMGVMGALTETDMAAMTAKLKEMALGGDHKAMKMLLDLAGLGKPAPLAPPEPQGVKALADAIADLVDEIRVAKAPPPKSRPGVLNGPTSDE